MSGVTVKYPAGVAAATLFLFIGAALPAQTISGGEPRASHSAVCSGGEPHASRSAVYSGNLDSRLSLAAGAGSAPAFSWGLEELANIRLQARIGEAAFYGAVNCIAAAGSFARAPEALALLAPQSPFSASFAPAALVNGENYRAAIELERLYFRLRGESLGLDLGLMRLAFGYGQVWGSSDFLNPKNPLAPFSRPRAILGTAVSAFPAGDIKLQLFAAAPKNPFTDTGEGLVFGLAGENHWQSFSAQILYAYETPQENYQNVRGDTVPAGSTRGIHRFGFSLKADIAIGLVADALVIWNPDSGISMDGLSAGAGFDYSFGGGSFYVLLEYLFNGLDSSTSRKYNALTGFSNRNYLYTLLHYRFSDYLSLGLSTAASFDDGSLTPGASLDYEFFQGMSLNVTARVPLDRDLFTGNGAKGELGPGAAQSYCGLEAMVRLKF
jgi:hypothetical protein